MKKLTLFIVFFISCSASLESATNQTTTSTTNNLSFCEVIEKQYTDLSNNLFNTSFELNSYIDNISPKNVDDDRESFFNDLSLNWEHQSIYKNYLETRYNVYNTVNSLYAEHAECFLSGDQQISDEQVAEAKKDLEDFIKDYEN